LNDNTTLNEIQPFDWLIFYNNELPFTTL